MTPGTIVSSDVAISGKCLHPMQSSIPVVYNASFNAQSFALADP